MHNTPLINRITRELSNRTAHGLFRRTATVSASPHTIDCSTNSYLGLHANKQVALDAAHLAGSSLSGNLASRLVVEYSPLYRELETEIAAWEGTEEGLVFTSGYTANIGILQALCTRSTEVFSDRLNHASIYDGIRLAGCKLTRYRHGDMSDLRRRLEASATTEKIIVTDTVFSMDGDRAPLADIADLAHCHQAIIVVDEAHATGLFGATGSGLVEATGTASAIDVRMGTFSKALAGLGGYVAVPKLLRDYFVNFARSLIYSTGLPSAVLAHNLAAVRFLRAHPKYGQQLQEDATGFRTRLAEAGFITRPSTTHIIPCYCSGPDEAVALQSFLHTHGITVPAIRPPTVPNGTSRLRFSWSLLFSTTDAEHIVTLLERWRSLHG